MCPRCVRVPAVFVCSEKVCPPVFEKVCPPVFEKVCPPVFEIVPRWCVPFPEHCRRVFGAWEGAALNACIA